MVSAGLLILLLVSSSFNISTTNGSEPTKHLQLEEAPLPAKFNQKRETSLLVKRNKLKPGERPSEDFNKVKEAGKIVASKFLGVLEKALGATIPVVALIPPYGTGMVVAGVLGAAQVGVSVANEKESEATQIMNELNNMKLTLDKYHLDQKWENWAPSFGKAELKIDIAWQMYTTTYKSVVKERDQNIKRNHISEFVKVYSPNYLLATNTLVAYMTASDKDITMLGNFRELLAEHVHCHENDILEYYKFISKLLYKGYIMNQFYFKYLNIESEARVDEHVYTAFDAASVMFKVHKKCIEDSITYVEKDVVALIDKTKPRQALCDNVWSFLSKVYNRYDWMVVAYVCKHSDHPIMEFLSSHVVAKFAKVIMKDGVCVAVARQIKGTHNNEVAAAITTAIKSCVPESVSCYEVEETLHKCGEVEVQGKKIKVSETYSAVHSYTSPNPHHQHGAQPAPNDDAQDEYSVPNPSETPYMYTGICKRAKMLPARHGYVILIKSEEEMLNKDPCVGMNCGQQKGKGKCVAIEGMFLGVCECYPPNYGLNCDEDIHKYKTELVQSLELKNIAIEY